MTYRYPFNEAQDSVETPSLNSVGNAPRRETKLAGNGVADQRKL